MEVVARIFNWNITRTELDFEESIVKKKHPSAKISEIKSFAINQLIDRYLLMQEAINHGITIEETELDEAIFDFIDSIDSPLADVIVNRIGRGEQLERLVTCHLYRKKYLSSTVVFKKIMSDDELHKFYLDRKDFFSHEEEIRASHILVKGRDEEAKAKINQIRSKIKTPEEFFNMCSCDSQCPSGMSCGDLGFFPKGRMIKEIEKVAFTLKINEISQPFLTKYGYHILMVTDKIPKHIEPFENIKEFLKRILLEIETEIAHAKLLADLREKHKNAIQILDHAFQ